MREDFFRKRGAARSDRPELKAALSYMRKGGTLVIWKLDRLARFLNQFIARSRILRAGAWASNRCKTS
jgi:DNA invertase Pin-like site-specific DNA recombinase